MQNDKISRSLNENQKYIKNVFEDSSDIIIRNFVIPSFNNCKAFILYVDGLIGAKEIDDIILKPLINNTQLPCNKNYIQSVGPIRALAESAVLAASVSAEILEGRIVIIVDNTPFSLIVPTVFWQYLQATGDYYERYYVGTFLRWLRLLALFLSLTLSSFYVMLSSFHQEMYPTLLALRVAAGREGVPFPSIIEVLLLE